MENQNEVQGSLGAKPPSTIKVFSILQIIFTSLIILSSVYAIFTATVGLTSGDLDSQGNFSFVFGDDFSAQDYNDLMRTNNIYSLSSSAVGLIIAIIGLIAAIGLLSYKEKARKWFVITALLFILLAVVNLVVGIILMLSVPKVSVPGMDNFMTIYSYFSIASSVFWFLVNVGYYGFIFFYFKSDKVKSFCK